MRIETIGDATLYLGDCLEILPTLEAVDTVLTDFVWPNVPPDMFSVDDPYLLLQSAVDMIEAKRLVIVMRYDSDPRFLRAVSDRWPFFRVQLLPYTVPGYNGRKLGGEEFAYSFGEPVVSNPGRRVIPGRAKAVQPPEKFDHPCPRSLDHMAWLVNWWSEQQETVLDPFMGSGTIGVAALRLGRRFIGIEIEPKYFDIACRRIEQENRQLKMF